MAKGTERASLDVAFGRFLPPILSPKGKTLASESFSTISLWDLQAAKRTAVLVDKLHHGYQIIDLAVVPDGKTLVLALDDPDQGIRFRDLGTGQELPTIGGSTGRLQALALSPDGQTVATSDSDRRVMLWDVPKRAVRIALPLQNSPVHALTFGPMAARSRPRREAVSRFGTAPLGKRALSLEFPHTLVSAIAFSPDGQTLATADSGHDDSSNEVKVWDVRSGRPLASLKGHSHRIGSIAFSSDGKTLASAGGELKFWDPVTFQERITLHDITDADSSRLAFSPDGRLLAAIARMLRDNIFREACVSARGRPLISHRNDRSIRIGTSVFTRGFTAESGTLWSFL